MVETVDNFSTVFTIMPPSFIVLNILNITKISEYKKYGSIYEIFWYFLVANQLCQFALVNNNVFVPAEGGNKYIQFT